MIIERDGDEFTKKLWRESLHTKQLIRTLSNARYDALAKFHSAARETSDPAVSAAFAAFELADSLLTGIVEDGDIDD